MRAKWTRAISGGGQGTTEIGPHSPTSNSYRNNKTSNVSSALIMTLTIFLVVGDKHFRDKSRDSGYFGFFDKS